jgi:23S rRNA (cytidine1920-2'-O)/16S rRNA (cytidine1409-2'-O)-methyltransferase
MTAPKKDRVDSLLVARGLCDSREQAKRLILAGAVRTGDTLVDKPSTKLAADAPLEVRASQKYVGRGGFKLEGALDSFAIDPTGWVCLDIGASTGGFTDCLLQRGATRVHAIDVGTNQLVWKIRSDPRVVSREKFNARNLTVEDLGEHVHLVVIDVSFISLTKILPAAFAVLDDGGTVVCLIKPQFELAREDVGKGGIIRDEDLRAKAVAKIQAFTAAHGRQWLGCVPAQIAGTDGNQEFLAWLA